MQRRPSEVCDLLDTNLWLQFYEDFQQFGELQALSEAG
jgi:hypothetical protein